MMLANSPSIITVFSYNGRVLHQNPRSRQYLGDRSPDDEDVLASVFGLEPSKATSMFEELGRPGSAGLWKAVMRVPHNLNPSLAPRQTASLDADSGGSAANRERPHAQRPHWLKAAASAQHSQQRAGPLLGCTPGHRRDLDQPLAQMAEERLTPNAASTCELGSCDGSITASRDLRSGNPSLMSSVITRALARAKFLPSQPSATFGPGFGPSAAINIPRSGNSLTEAALRNTEGSGHGTSMQTSGRGKALRSTSASLAFRRQASAGPSLATGSPRGDMQPTQGMRSVTFVEHVRTSSVTAGGGGSMLFGHRDSSNGAVWDPFATSTFATLVDHAAPATPPSAKRACPAPVVPRGNSIRRSLGPDAACAANTNVSGDGLGPTSGPPHLAASCESTMTSHDFMVTVADSDTFAIEGSAKARAGDDSGSNAASAVAAAAAAAGVGVGVGSGRRPVSATIAIPQSRSRALAFALSLGTSPLAAQSLGSPVPSSDVLSPPTSSAHATEASQRDPAAAAAVHAGAGASRAAMARPLQGPIRRRAHQSLDQSAVQQAGAVPQAREDAAHASPATLLGSAPQGLQTAPGAVPGPKAVRRRSSTGRRAQALVRSSSKAATGAAGAGAVASSEGRDGGDGGGVAMGADVAGPFAAGPQDDDPECWHEVWAKASHDTVTGQRVIILSQMDVTAKVVAERHLALVMESEHRLVEQIFPRHVLQYVTEEWTAKEAAGGGAPAGKGGAGDCGGSGRWQQPLLRDCSALTTWHPEVTLLFADVKGFTPLCNEISPREVMVLLNSLYSRYDSMLDTYGVYKVETIGDCYFVAGGLIREDEDGMAAVREGGRREDTDPLHADRVFMFAKAMLAAAREVLMPTTGQPVEIRIGIHTGPVASGVVGTRMPRFCLFGDTVNTASRMESTGQPGAIHVSEATFGRLAPSDQWEPTGGIQVKGKGLMQTYLWRPPEHAAQLDDLSAAARATVATASGMGADARQASCSSLMPLSTQLLFLAPDAAQQPRLGSLSPADHAGVSRARRAVDSAGDGGDGSMPFGGFLASATRRQEKRSDGPAAALAAPLGRRDSGEEPVTATLCCLVGDGGMELHARSP